MHLHTAECDKCVTVNAENTAALYKEAGYSGIVVTDHYFALSAEWFGIEQNEENHRKFIDRWLRGYRSIKEAGEKIGLQVFLGAEARFDGANINDYLIYGITEEFLYGAPYLNKLKDVSELMKILPPETIVVQAHPFRNGMTVSDPSCLFGIEVNNGGTDATRNALAESFAEFYGKSKLSGSDFHTRSHLAKGGIIFDTNPESYAELISDLKEGKYSLIRSKK